MQTKGFYLRVAVLVCHALLSVTLANVQKKPNILVIFGDDIGWFNLSAYNMGMMGIARPTSTGLLTKGRCSPATTRLRKSSRGFRLPILVCEQAA
jgi:hypothetical protein